MLSIVFAAVVVLPAAGAVQVACVAGDYHCRPGSVACTFPQGGGPEACVPDPCYTTACTAVATAEVGSARLASACVEGQSDCPSGMLACTFPDGGPATLCVQDPCYTTRCFGADAPAGSDVSCSQTVTDVGASTSCTWGPKTVGHGVFACQDCLPITLATCQEDVGSASAGCQAGSADVWVAPPLP